VFSFSTSVYFSTATDSIRLPYFRAGKLLGGLTYSRTRDIIESMSVLSFFLKDSTRVYTSLNFDAVICPSLI
jgi:hypothetical protein